MYTQCPKCNSQRPVSVEDLRSSKGMLNCYTCSSKFDALELLSKGYVPGKKKKADISENKDEQLSSGLEESRKAIDFKRLPFNLWGLASSLCLLVFIFQIYHFEGYNLTQNKIFRPWLENICVPLGCELPVYKNLDELALLHGSFEQAENKENFVFKAAFTNQSDFEQLTPSIKLTLVDFTGTDFAERIFHPSEFLKLDSVLIEPDVTSEISIDIANPAKKIGGYRFELI